MSQGVRVIPDRQTSGGLSDWIEANRELLEPFKVGTPDHDAVCLMLDSLREIMLRPDRLDRVSWRIADAGLLFRQAIERTGKTNVVGLDEPTGRGAMLPRGK